MGNFDNYTKTEITSQSGGKIVRKVTIKNGHGYKSVTKYRKGKKVSSVKKPIHKQHISLIKSGKFIPGLFKDCKRCRKTKKHRGGYGADPYNGQVPMDVDDGQVPMDVDE